MEAANLGAFAPDEASLWGAVDRLAAVPSFLPDVVRGAGRPRRARRPPADPRRQTRVRSIGIPTWFYGHEPPNVFCNGIAKFFSNALREDGLLARSTAGFVVLEGAAGTVQEIFQAATPLYYSREGAALPVVVLVGRQHWTSWCPSGRP